MTQQDATHKLEHLVVDADRGDLGAGPVELDGQPRREEAERAPRDRPLAGHEGRGGRRLFTADGGMPSNRGTRLTSCSRKAR